MRVLKDKILIGIKAASANSLVGNSSSRKGIVEESGSEQIKKGELILFGDSFEEIQTGKETTKRLYLMDIANVKVIFDESRESEGNILPFFKGDSNV